ncbi:MAG: 3-isopropylmalate dehydratase small subunit [Desulfobulbaceae bacterium]|uniref:3-isopropylmalate dehydratase n=1 Tax=Candidatus Desulfobia pelagia TaxID=2841692 RepID=A0A8J6NF34_9BACT|nr:3-isopropylmalate dehydratase small subunit [Candidatus Desulfobia pelagia]
MKTFGGQALFLDRNDINTDEIIPAKYLTENSKLALKPYVLEDLKLPGFNVQEDIARANVVVTRANFGCGSSREHAVWVFEVNNINTVIGESFARIFRQNMFNCGMLAIELSKEDIDTLFQLGGDVIFSIDVENETLTAKGNKEVSFSFSLNSFDKDLLVAGGWLAYADQKF